MIYNQRLLINKMRLRFYDLALGRGLSKNSNLKFILSINLTLTYLHLKQTYDEKGFLTRTENNSKDRF